VAPGGLGDGKEGGGREVRRGRREREERKEEEGDDIR